MSKQLPNDMNPNRAQSFLIEKAIVNALVDPIEQLKLERKMLTQRITEITERIQDIREDREQQRIEQHQPEATAKKVRQLEAQATSAQIPETERRHKKELAAKLRDKL